MSRSGRPRWPLAYAGLPGTVYALFVANVAFSLGNLVWPMLTPLLQQGLGFPPGWAGVLLTVSMVATALGALAGGQLADGFGRAKVFVASRGLVAASVGACVPLAMVKGAAPEIAGLLVAASLLRGASEPALQALLADLTPEDRRPAAFSLLYLGNKAGFLAPLLAGLFFRSHLAWLFLGTAATAACSAVLAAPALRRPRPDSPGTPRRTPGDGSAAGLLTVLRLRPRLVVASLLLAALSFVHVQHLYALPLQASEWYGASGARLYGYLLSFNAPAYLQSQAPPSHRGRIGAATGLLAQAGYALGPGLTGILLVRSGLRAVWLASLLVSVAGAAGLFFLGEEPAPLDGGPQGR